MKRRGGQGFTLVELMLALALATVVLGVVLSMLRMLVVVDRRGLERFEQTVDLSIAHRSLSRMMQNLLAAPPPVPASPAPPPGLATEMEAQVERALAEGAEQADGESALLDAASGQARDALARFEIYFEEFGPNVDLPRLELVTSLPPVRPIDSPLLDEIYDQAYAEALGYTVQEANELALQRAYTSAYRGALEVRPVLDDTGTPVEWVLQYAPIDPPSRPVILVRDIRGLFWQALPSASKGSQWADVWVAWEAPQYPIAVRLAMSLGDGTIVDWVFETAVSVGGE
jgi:prepilin-type N-terminal cleavage/methylation domain-containing protein